MQNNAHISTTIMSDEQAPEIQINVKGMRFSTHYSARD
jgi:hypothetical protein